MEDIKEEININVLDESKIQKLTDQQKKTIWEWTKYLGKAVLTAILKKLLGES